MDALAIVLTPVFKPYSRSPSLGISQDTLKYPGNHVDDVDVLENIVSVLDMNGD